MTTPADKTYTPGPWIVGGDLVILIGSDAVAAEKGGLTIGEAYFWMGIDEAEANARLIAAAPDLLEACKLLEAADDFHDNCEECGDAETFPELCGECFPLFDDARIKRRAAIAKAEGRL